MSADNIVQRRRASDWKKPLSVLNHDPFGWREGDSVAFLDDKATARIGAAINGARTLTALLMQHDMDRNAEDDEGLHLGAATTYGLFEALASCLELADLHATGGQPSWTTQMNAADPEAEHMRQAACRASVDGKNRRAVYLADLVNKAQAAKKGAA